MKKNWEKWLLTMKDPQEATFTRNTIIMIVLFLSFFGVSFYVMMNSLFS